MRSFLGSSSAATRSDMVIRLRPDAPFDDPAQLDMAYRDRHRDRVQDGNAG
jgi:hypothetical protein